MRSTTTSRTTLAIASLAALATAFAGCAQKKEGDSGGSEDPIVIGAALAESGFLEFYDGPAKVGAELAIEDLNADGGVLGRQLELTTADMKSDPALGSRAALDVIDKGATMVLASCDFEFGSPAAITAQEEDLISFSVCAGSPKFGPVGIGPLAYTPATWGGTEGATFAQWAYSNKGWRTAYSLVDTTLSHTEEACAEFDKAWQAVAGDDALTSDSFQQEDASIASQISKIKSMSPQPDFIYLCSYIPGGASAIKQIRDAGIDLPIGSLSNMDGDYWLEGLTDLSNFYLTAWKSVHGDDPDPAVNDFVKRYTEKTGEAPPISFALCGYQAVQAWSTAVERAGTLDADAVASELDSFTDEKFLCGNTTYSPDVHILWDRPLTILEVNKGKFSFLEEYQAENLPEPAA